MAEDPQESALRRSRHVVSGEGLPAQEFTAILEPAQHFIATLTLGTSVPGPQGPEGPQGIQGPQGIPGQDGTSIRLEGTVATAADLPATGNTSGDAWVVADTGELHVWDEVWYNAGVFPTGPAGPQGLQGIQGTQGIQGPPGTGIFLKGSVTNSGQLPTKGNKPGDAYLVSSTGHIHVWSGTAWVDAGMVQGPPGPAGIQGVPGPQGAAGNTGATGPAGIQGPAGPQGIQGTQGIPGIQGPQGIEGPPGVGINTKGTVPNFASLPAGASPGDAYITSDTGDLWVWSSAGSWVNAGHVVGPVGPQGPAGAQGPQGIQGIQGPAGPAGTSLIIADEGAALLQRPMLNFTGPGVTVTDDAANSRTVVTIEGGGAVSADTERYANEAANAAADAMAAKLNNGYLRIYSGTQPATADTAVTSQVLLAELRFGATAFAAASNGTANANAITGDSSANATGTASWFRALKSDAVSPVFDGKIGLSGADLNMNTLSITAGAAVLVTGFTITQQR